LFGFFLMLAGAGPFLIGQAEEATVDPSEQISFERLENSQTAMMLNDPGERALWSLDGVGGGVTCLTSDGAALEACAGDSGERGEARSVSASQERIYVVREGDTISQVAEMFGVTPNTVVWANDLGDHIHEGQHLVILPFSGIRHQVEEGDSLQKIAEKYEAEAEEVKEFNNITDESLVVGEFVDVKGGVKPEPEPQVAQERAQKRGPAPTAQTVEQGYFIRPISGGIRTQGAHGPGNTAVDLAAPYGTPIYAAAEGTVIKSVTGGYNGGYGNYVEIKHPNGTRTLYAHNSQNTVAVGEYVSRGQVIAYMGSTGRSTGPHVHFEVHGAANPF